MDDCFIERIAGINDVVGVHAESVLELHNASEGAVDDYLLTCKKAKRSPQNAYSGHVMLRMTPELHAKIAMQAKAHGKSLNSWVSEVLSTN